MIRFTVADEFRGPRAAALRLRPRRGRGPPGRRRRPARRRCPGRAPSSRRASRSRSRAGFEAQVRARSGLALKKGLALANGVGTIDADYRGEVGVIVVNLGAEPVTIDARRPDRAARRRAGRAGASSRPPASLETSARGSRRLREHGLVSGVFELAIAFLGSGSSGNCAVVRVRDDGRPRRRGPLRARDEEAPRACAASPSRTSRRVFLTHEHSDHVYGALALSTKGGPARLRDGRDRGRRRASRVRSSRTCGSCAAGADLVVGDLHVRVTSTPHDGVESVCYVFADGAGPARRDGHGPRAPLAGGPRRARRTARSSASRRTTTRTSCARGPTRPS